MMSMRFALALACLPLALTACQAPPASMAARADKPVIERLYILDCGEGVAAHFKENWDNRRVPEINFNKEQTSASMQRLADILAKENAQLWINHDKAQRDRQKMSPEFYE